MSEDDVCIIFWMPFYYIMYPAIKNVFYYKSYQSYALNRHVSPNKNILATYFL